MPEDQQKNISDDALEELDRRLNMLKRKTDKNSVSYEVTPHPIARMMWLAFNVVSDLIAGVICGFGMGYGLDHWLGTRPVFIAVFLILGCIAGILNVIRFLQNYDKRQSSEGKE